MLFLYIMYLGNKMVNSIKTIKREEPQQRNNIFNKYT